MTDAEHKVIDGWRTDMKILSDMAIALATELPEAAALLNALAMREIAQHLSEIKDSLKLLANVEYKRMQQGR